MYDGEEYIGCGAFYGDSVEAFTTEHHYTDGVDWSTFTIRACLPVSYWRLNNSTQPVNIIQHQWYDVALGISNPNIFVPPAICPQ